MICLADALKEGNGILAVSSLLESSEVHLGLRDVGLRVLQVVEESLLGPGDTYMRKS